MITSKTSKQLLRVLPPQSRCPGCQKQRIRATSKTGKEKHGMMIQAPDRERPTGGSSTRSRQRQDVYTIVTERILDLLAQGTAPWVSSSIARSGMPTNFLTKKPYSGINVFLLGSAHFQSPYFLTYRQAQQLGGQVRKGEKGFPIIKMGTWEKKSQEPSNSDDHATRKATFLKLYSVFNACQIDGIDFPEPPSCPGFTESTMASEARRIADNMPKPPIVHVGQKAYPHYIPDEDTIHMPTRESFRSEYRFYKTLFHELAHATGHATRLNRTTLTENRGMFAVGEAKKIYCQEELTAEMTAAFLSTHAGIVEDDLAQSAAYLNGWLEVLRVPDHKKWLIRSASEAQKAADYILRIKRS